MWSQGVDQLTTRGVRCTLPEPGISYPALCRKLYFPRWIQEKTNFVRTKYFFMLLFCICLPLPMKETTPLRGNSLQCLLWENFYVTWWPDLISSVGTSFKTCKNLKKAEICKRREGTTMPPKGNSKTIPSKGKGKLKRKLSEGEPGQAAGASVSYSSFWVCSQLLT